MKKMQTSDTIELGILLALSGGFMDAYSYICRGKVFANAQTGNILLSGIAISQGNYYDMYIHITPVIFFSIGIFLAMKISDIYKANEKLHWRQISIIIEIILFLVVCFIPLEYNLLANNITSMGCGIQLQSFRKLHGNGIATTMCIGNLRSANENLHSFFNNKDKKYLIKSFLYYFIIICFAVGAIMGNISIKLMGKESMIVCVGILFVCFLFMNKKESNSLLDL